MANDLMDPLLWDEKWVSKQGSYGRSKFGWLSSAETRRFRDLLAKLMDAAGKRRMKILELGCAPGEVLKLAHSIRPHHEYYGIDYTNQGVEITREKLRQSGMKATIWYGDIFTFRPPESFDMVMSCGLVEHFDDPLSILRCHVSFTVPGGFIAVTLPNFSHPIVQLFCRWFNPEKLESHNTALMDPSRLMSAMQRCGLTNIHVGSSGSPKLPDSTSSRPSAKIYGYFSSAFNLISCTVPHVPVLWNSMVWGHGRAKRD